MTCEPDTWSFEMLAVGNFRSLEKHTKDGAEDMTALAKWRILNRLHDRNETLYYRVSFSCSIKYRFNIFGMFTSISLV